MKKNYNMSLLRGLSICICAIIWSLDSFAIEIEDINIRNPYIMPWDGKYLMYSTSDTLNAEGKTIGGVMVYESINLKSWSSPRKVLTLPEDNFINGSIWAPEVHEYKGKFYLFATINSDLEWARTLSGYPPKVFRFTQIFCADSPLGPFKPLGKGPVTRTDRMVLDGTLWVEDNVPYMVYCHEWVQICDGGVEIIQLSDDLSQRVSEPVRLFNASAAKWVTPVPLPEESTPGYVTDGCFIYRTQQGKLLMIWSSFSNGNYAIGIAESVSGSVLGPWKQQDKPLFEKNGGHGMIFKTFDGKLCLVLHQPNGPTGCERPHVYELIDTGNSLKLKNEL